MNKNIFTLILVLVVANFVLTGCDNNSETDERVSHITVQKEDEVVSYVVPTGPSGKIKIIVRNASYPITDPGGNDMSSYYELREREMDIPLSQTALILIDTWDLEQPRHIDSRKTNVFEKIKPILNIARELDMLVLHAPHRSIGWDGVNKNKNKLDLRSPSSTPRLELPAWLKSRKISESQWPPINFVFRVGEFGKYSTYNNPSYLPYPRILGIQKDLLPRKRSREFIESSPGKVQKIFRDNKILHLLYVGMATNQCIVNRPVGIRKMSSIGYNTIIVRGATVGSELNSTYDSQQVTNSAILDIEINNGFSVSSSNLLGALESLNSSLKNKKERD